MCQIVVFYFLYSINTACQSERCYKMFMPFRNVCDQVYMKQVKFNYYISISGIFESDLDTHFVSLILTLVPLYKFTSFPMWSGSYAIHVTDCHITLQSIQRPDAVFFNIYLLVGFEGISARRQSLYNKNNFLPEIKLII